MIGCGLDIASVAARGAAAAPIDVVSADSAFLSSTWQDLPGQPWGIAPANKMFFVNNLFGKGSLINGVDYTCKLTARRVENWMSGALLEWDFGNGGGTGIGTFCYGFPSITFRGSSWGSAFNVGSGSLKIAETPACSVTYDIEIGGNTDSYNVLIDVYATTAQSSTDGTHDVEISFFPHAPADLPFAPDSVLRQFSFGWCQVGLQGTQACFFPVEADGATHRSILSGTIDILELALYCVHAGWTTDQTYLRGAEFGVEIEVPAAWNSAPHAGSLRYKHLSYDWPLAAGEPALVPTLLQRPVVWSASGVGQGASGGDGDWLAAPDPTFTYQWLRDGAPIAGETSASLNSIVADDVDKALVLATSATNASGTTIATSIPIWPKATPNLIIVQDLNENYWQKSLLTVLPDNVMQETEGTGDHSMAPGGGLLTRAAGVKTYRMSADVVLQPGGWPCVLLQAYDTSWGRGASARFDCGDLTLGYYGGYGGWTVSGVPTVTALPDGKVRVAMDFTTDGVSTDLRCLYRATETVDSGGDGAGDPTRQMQWFNLWVYET